MRNGLLFAGNSTVVNEQNTYWVIENGVEIRRALAWRWRGGGRKPELGVMAIYFNS